MFANNHVRSKQKCIDCIGKWPFMIISLYSQCVFGIHLSIMLYPKPCYKGNVLKGFDIFAYFSKDWRTLSLNWWKWRTNCSTQFIRLYFLELVQLAWQHWTIYRVEVHLYLKMAQKWTLLFEIIFHWVKFANQSDTFCHLTIQYSPPFGTNYIYSASRVQHE